VISDSYNAVFDALKDAVGWGIIFVGLALFTLIYLLWRGIISSLWRNWNRWLGAAALLFAPGGYWHFPARVTRNPGGAFGMGIIGAHDFPGCAAHLRPVIYQCLPDRAAHDVGGRQNGFSAQSGRRLPGSG